VAEKARSRESAKRGKELRLLEDRIAQAERRLSELESFLANPDLYGDRTRFDATLAEYQTLKGERDRLYDRYEWMEREGGQGPGGR
jgi:hypothetical protein